MLAIQIEKIAVAAVLLFFFGRSLRKTLWPWARTLWMDVRGARGWARLKPVARESVCIAMLLCVAWFSASAAAYLPDGGPVFLNMFLFHLVAGQTLMLLWSFRRLLGRDRRTLVIESKTPPADFVGPIDPRSYFRSTHAVRAWTWALLVGPAGASVLAGLNSYDARLIGVPVWISNAWLLMNAATVMCALIGVLWVRSDPALRGRPLASRWMWLGTTATIALVSGIAGWFGVF
jgi:hypothetical protein